MDIRSDDGKVCTGSSRCSASRSRSSSRSDSQAGSNSRSRSRSRSGSHSDSKSCSHSRRSRSPCGSRSCSSSRSRSRSGSPSGSRSRSRSGSPSGSRSRSRSGSPSGSRSRSRSGSPSGSRSRSRSGSPSGSRSRSRSGSPSGSRSRSRSGSPSASRSRSPSCDARNVESRNDNSDGTNSPKTINKQVACTGSQSEAIRWYMPVCNQMRLCNADGESVGGNAWKSQMDWILALVNNKPKKAGFKTPDGEVFCSYTGQDGSTPLKVMPVEKRATRVYLDPTFTYAGYGDNRVPVQVGRCVEGVQNTVSTITVFGLLPATAKHQEVTYYTFSTRAGLTFLSGLTRGSACHENHLKIHYALLHTFGEVQNSFKMLKNATELTEKKDKTDDTNTHFQLVLLPQGDTKKAVHTHRSSAFATLVGHVGHNVRDTSFSNKLKEWTSAIAKPSCAELPSSKPNEFVVMEPFVTLSHGLKQWYSHNRPMTLPSCATAMWEEVTRKSYAEWYAARLQAALDSSYAYEKANSFADYIYSKLYRAPYSLYTFKPTGPVNEDKRTRKQPVRYEVDTFSEGSLIKHADDDQNWQDTASHLDEDEDNGSLKEFIASDDEEVSVEEESDYEPPLKTRKRKKRNNNIIDELESLHELFFKSTRRIRKVLKRLKAQEGQ